MPALHICSHGWKSNQQYPSDYAFPYSAVHAAQYRLPSVVSHAAPTMATGVAHHTLSTPVMQAGQSQYVNNTFVTSYFP